MYRFIPQTSGVCPAQTSIDGGVSKQAVMRVRRTQIEDRKAALQEHRVHRSVGMLFEVPAVAVDVVRHPAVCDIIRRLREFVPSSDGERLRCTLKLGNIDETTGMFCAGVRACFLDRQHAIMAAVQGWTDALPAWLPHTCQRVATSTAAQVDINTIFTTTQPFVVTQHTVSKPVANAVVRMWHGNPVFPNALQLALTVERDIPLDAFSHDTICPVAVTNSSVKAFRAGHWTYRLWRSWSGDDIKEAGVIRSTAAPSCCLEIELQDTAAYFAANPKRNNDMYVACNYVKRALDTMTPVGDDTAMTVQEPMETIC